MATSASEEEHQGSAEGDRSAVPSETVREFGQVARSLLEATTVAGVLQRIVDAAHRLVPGADLVSVTLLGPDGTFHTPVGTAREAVELDRLQYDTGEGPCVDAARESGPECVRSPDLAIQPDWPAFGPAAAEYGFRSVLSTAMPSDPQPPPMRGALNVYSRRRDGLDTAARDVALLLATHASLALATTKALTYAELQQAQLRKAIASRDVIGQAKGILMQKRGITSDEAFAVLSAASQNLNMRLADLAADLADRSIDLPT
jgi:GAF domain-containing protein